MPNPFFYGPYIADPRYFVGRAAELQTIFSALETAYTGQVQPVSIFGPRRIGKSSLLYHVTQVYPRHLQNPSAYTFVYIDLDDARCHTQAGLLEYILEKLNLPPIPGKLTMEAFSIALAALQRAQMRRQNAACPVLCLDEFEHLTMRKPEFPDEFFTAMRSLAQQGRVALLTASKTPLVELFAQGGLTSPFHNIFQQLELGNLTDAESEELVNKGRTCDRPFSGDECNEVRKMGGNNPYALQVAGSLLYKAKGSPPVDWGKLRRNFHAQVNFATRHEPASKKSIVWLRKALVWLAQSPKHLGRAVLDIWKFDKAAESTAWILGSGLILLAILILFRVVDWMFLVDLFKRCWKFINPAK